MSSAAVAAQLCTLSTYAIRGPSNAAGIFAIGIGDPNLAGILCAALRTTADVTVPVTTDALGGINSLATPLSVSFPLPGPLTLYTQFAALDTTQPKVPVALSDATKLTCVPWVGPQVPSFLYSWSPIGGASSPTGTRYSSYVPIIRFTW